MHNQVITMGEWGWAVGAKGLDSARLKPALQSVDLTHVPTRWINSEAMVLITSFGKEILPESNKEIEINTLHNPVLYKYYMKGSWDLY
jgi:spermidine synthase